MECNTQYKSKNLIAERNRRNKLNAKLYALRALVPNITKMNKAMIIDDAFDYIKALKKKVEDLQAELVELTNEEGERQTIVASADCWDESMQKMENCEVEVVVSTIDANKFIIKIASEKKQGGFTKLMETLAEIGLEVTNITVTTFKSVILNIVCAQGRENEILQADQVKDRLMQMVGHH